MTLKQKFQMGEVLELENCSTKSPVVESKYFIPNAQLHSFAGNAKIYLTQNISTQLPYAGLKNMEKLESFRHFQINWNGNGALPFIEGQIEKAKSILFNLPKQPEIFPTARQSVQFEYEKENGDYLEFEIFEDSISCLKIVAGMETESHIDESGIFSIVNNFYASDRNLRS